MRISARGEYAIQAVLDLTLHRHGPLVPLQDIASRQRIPPRYLEHVLLALRRAGILTSRRGSTGGYHLTRRPEDVTVGDVLRAVEGDESPLDATTRRRGTRAGDLAELWDEVAEAVTAVVDRFTFADLAARVADRRGGPRAMYHI